MIEKYKINTGDDIDEYQIPYKKVIKQRLFHAKDDDSIGEKEFFRIFFLSIEIDQKRTVTLKID